MQEPLYITFQEVLFDGQRMFQPRFYSDTASLLKDATLVGLVQVCVIRELPPGDMDVVREAFRDTPVSETKEESESWMNAHLCLSVGGQV